MICLQPEYYRDNSEFLRVTNGNRYQLKIPHVKLSHTGSYTLLAANPHGQIKALISLQVYSAGIVLFNYIYIYIIQEESKNIYNN